MVMMTVRDYSTFGIILRTKSIKNQCVPVETLRENIRTSCIFQVRLKRYMFALKIIVPRDIMKRVFINNYLSKKTDFQ